MRVRFLSGAKRELFEVRDRYEQIEQGLGNRFYLQVESAIADLAQDPTRFPIHRWQVRRCLIKRFRYAVLFEVRSAEILIVAIMHTSRRPGYWKTRVAKK